MRGKVLAVDDDSSMCELITEALGWRGFEVSTCFSAASALEILGQRDFDVVVTDLNMGGMNGIELCERIAFHRPDLPVIVITAFGSLDTAIAAIRVGAYDFITKPFEMESLAITLDRAVQFRRLRDELKRLQSVVSEGTRPNALLGDSRVMKGIYALISRIAETDGSVLIAGETGTGKELVARAIHEASGRRAGPFVTINCAAMPEALFESELFGHARGAFTDARQARQGLILRAHGGTLFLDEVGELPLTVQPKLLRVLQERRLRPVGSDVEQGVDVRIITATHRDLESSVEQGMFREDLYFRINVIGLSLPPLRARGNDVLLLAQHFTAQFASSYRRDVVGISRPAAEKLLAYSWPGNVRELKNCIERAVALTQFDHITLEDLPEKVREYSSSHVLIVSDSPSELLPLDEVERRYVLRVLDAVQGNKALAARILGLDRRTLYRKLERYEGTVSSA